MSAQCHHERYSVHVEVSIVDLKTALFQNLHASASPKSCLISDINRALVRRKPAHDHHHRQNALPDWLLSTQYLSPETWIRILSVSSMQ